jgi:hypothetical protein
VVRFGNRTKFRANIGLTRYFRLVPIVSSLLGPARGLIPNLIVAHGCSGQGWNRGVCRAWPLFCGAKILGAVVNARVDVPVVKLAYCKIGI